MSDNNENPLLNKKIVIPPEEVGGGELASPATVNKHPPNSKGGRWIIAIFIFAAILWFTNPSAVTHKKALGMDGVPGARWCGFLCHLRVPRSSTTTASCFLQ